MIAYGEGARRREVGFPATKCQLFADGHSEAVVRSNAVSEARRRKSSSRSSRSSRSSGSSVQWARAATSGGRSRRNIRVSAKKVPMQAVDLAHEGETAGRHVPTCAGDCTTTLASAATSSRMARTAALLRSPSLSDAQQIAVGIDEGKLSHAPRFVLGRVRTRGSMSRSRSASNAKSRCRLSTSATQMSQPAFDSAGRSSW